MGEDNIADEDMAAESKIDPSRERTPSSIESTPSPEPEAGGEPSQEQAQPQKRKGGRKPIYATSEERKQRNRQAQAAFRERRTEYIKQLEATIKQNEDTLSSLQQSHRSAADECLMLRYKNSLLERILLEKGIDVQAELSMKTGSPTLGFQHPGANIPQIPPPQPQLQRTAIQRHQARRSGHFLPRLAPGHSNSTDLGLQRSPQGHPTPSSHASSPTSISARSPMILQRSGNSPPTSAGLAQPQRQQYHQFSPVTQQPPSSPFYQASQMSPNSQRPAPPRQHHSSTSVVSNHSTSGRQNLTTSLNPGLGTPISEQPPSSLYSDPFQKHIDQLEQEYDTQQTRSMLDQPDQDDMSDPSPDQLRGNYPPQFEQQTSQHGDYYHAPANVSRAPQQQARPNSHSNTTESQFAAISEIIDPDDPMLDADPFGLSASMHYPTSYAFEQPPQRSMS